MNEQHDERLVVRLNMPQRTVAPVPPRVEPPKAEPPRVQQPKPKKRRWLRWLLLVLILFLFGIAAFLFFVRAPSSTASVPDTASDAAAAPVPDTQTLQIPELIEKIGRHIVLPEGEVPTVAAVTDPAQLAGQAFFEKAKEGDIVLLYTLARKAYLYDPREDKLVEVAPITTDPQ